MRHRVVKKTLNRDKDHRKALTMNLITQIIEEGKINTTLAKAKYIKPKVERVITKGIKANKTGDKISKFNIVKNIRKEIRSESAIRKLVDEVAPKFLERKGGYTRIIKTGNRDGDNAQTARIELVSNIEETKEKLKRKVSKKENKDENKTK